MAPARDRRSRSTRRAAAPLVAAFLAGCLFVAAPPAPVRADNGRIDTASSTYTLVPARGVLQVTIDLAAANRIPSTSTAVYYINQTYAWVEKGARNLRITADQGSVGRTVAHQTADYVDYRLTFANTFYGQTRRIHIAYELPGGTPRSATWTRVGRAYTDFCVTTNGYDRGEVRVVIPAAFTVTTTPRTLTPKRTGSNAIFTSGAVANPTEYYACFEGTNEAGFKRETLTSPSGRNVIVESWPEDPAWATALRGEVGASVGALEKLLGSPLPGTGAITVREVTANELGDYVGDFNTRTQIARVSEDYDVPGVIAHELSHAWFNRSTLATTWLAEGLAGWAERVSPTAGAACTKPSEYPGKGTPDLDAWTFLGPRSTDADRALVDYDYQAACWIMSSLTERMGRERMGTVVAALLARRSAYSTSPAAVVTGSGPADWRLFLDLVDELGLVPAGVSDLEVAQNLLLEFGVAAPASLQNRAAARTAYHALLADPSGWGVPGAIRTDLERWTFTVALSDIAAANEALTLARSADAALPGSGVMDGPVRAAFASATFGPDLAAARDLAAAEARAASDVATSLATVRAALPGMDTAHGPVMARFRAALTTADFGAADDLAVAQAVAAKDVADAIATIEAPRDAFQGLGLADVDLQAKEDAGLAAVRSADAPAAALAADDIRAVIAGSADVGRAKALTTGGAIAAGLLALVGLVFLFRRRRRPIVVPVLAAAAPPPTPDGPGADAGTFGPRQREMDDSRFAPPGDASDPLGPDTS